MLKYVLTIYFISLLNYAIAQSPLNILGTWKGRFEQFNLDAKLTPLVSMDYTMVFKSFDGDKVYGTIKYENISDGSKPVTFENVEFYYTRGIANGDDYDKIKIEHETVLDNKTKYFGILVFRFEVIDGRRGTEAFLVNKKMIRCKVISNLRNQQDLTNPPKMEFKGDKIYYPRAVNRVSESITTSNENKTAVNNSELSRGASQLFKDVQSNLRIQDKNYIFSNLRLIPKSDGDGFTTKEAHPKDRIPVEVYLLDINGDGKEEIFLSYSDVNGKGRAHSHLTMFLPKSDGYKMNVDLDYNAFLPEFTIPSNGYPLLRFGGMNSDIWGWDGNEYKVLRKSTSADYPKLISFEDYSAIYKRGGADAIKKQMGNFTIPKRTNVIESNTTSSITPKVETRLTVIAKKGTSSKFIGKWYAYQQDNTPFAFTKVGTSFLLTSTKATWEKAPIFVYNIKNDRMEGWGQNQGIKVNMVVTYNYEENELVITPTKDMGYDIYLAKKPK